MVDVFVAQFESFDLQVSIDWVGQLGTMPVFLEAATPYKFAIFAFFFQFIACGFIRVPVGFVCAAGYSVLTLGFVKLLEWTRDAASAAAVLRFLAFQNYLFIFCTMLYGRDAMKFFTNWSLLFHIQYFGLPRHPALDGVARVAHAAGFAASNAVFFGFLACVAVGGAVPPDVLLRVRSEPVTSFSLSMFIGWLHGGPTLLYILDALLSPDYLRRIYRRRSGKGLFVGGLVLFVVGQIWELCYPDTMAIYAAPQPVWNERGRRFARVLGVRGSDEDLRLRKNALHIGEDVAFSNFIKYGGLAGAAAAAVVLNALVLDPGARTDGRKAA